MPVARHENKKNPAMRERLTPRRPELIKFPMPVAPHENKENPAMAQAESEYTIHSKATVVLAFVTWHAKATAPPNL